jgi:hypothetical protein
MQSALRALRETLALGNVSCPRQQFNQDNRLYCALQAAFPNILFRRLSCVMVIGLLLFSRKRSWRKTAPRKTSAIREDSVQHRDSSKGQLGPGPTSIRLEENSA